MSTNQRILTDDEVNSLLEGARNNINETSLPEEFDAMLIQTCLYHGLRNQETVTLQRQHVDFQQIGVNIERKNTKSDAGVRFVPTPDHFIDEFVEWVEQQTGSRDDYLFPSPRSSGHISEKYFQEQVMRRLAVRQGLYPPFVTEDNVTEEMAEEERVRPHALRHTYGTRCYERGVPPKELSSLMGHKSIQTTMDLYSHLANERNRDLVDDVWG